jgi:LysM repeat protein
MRPVARSILVALAAALLVGALGCEFTNSERRKTEAATTEEMSAIRSELGRLRQDVDALDRDLARSDKALRDEIAALRQSVADLESKSAGQVAAAVETLTKAINEVEDKRVSDKNALNKKIDWVADQLKQALGATSTGATSTGGSTDDGSRTTRGFEYTVKEGDTVSKIAAKFRDDYGTTIKAILDANNLTVNSIIRPGDVLFVPITKEPSE